VTRAGSRTLLPHLRRARDVADRHHAQPLDLDALAGAAHVSKYHFIRCFTEVYGETPMRYLTRRRIERAQDLLRSANLTITEVCVMVGFSSLGSFSSRFRELVGETPTQYRDRWAARGGPHIPGCFLFMRGIDRWPAGSPRPEIRADGPGEQSGRSTPPVPPVPSAP
jgi:AraC-like DNA-binding protein